MKLAINVDHIATIREARKSNEPEPVLAALLAEQAGADGIVCHIRGDRRHIKVRDLLLFRQVVKTKLNVEMAATEDMKKIALDIKPDIVSLVPEREEELTTEGGLDVISNEQHLAPHIQELKNAGIRVSIFVDPDLKQIEACHKVGVDLIEINTGKYADLKPGKERDEALDEIKKAADFGYKLGLEIHAGHGLDYRNVRPVAAIPEITEFSIGFSIVARAAIVGIEEAVKEMIVLIE
ncbi:MAG: pyridoxine 5'-phosphate synthase [Candidatus Aminicenantes bacterium]|nr:MAG: pyridoxine 5'-phosphate synthase [Candidatus Aminicenantes bacterium]